jgi:hypothetical protein
MNQELLEAYRKCKADRTIWEQHWEEIAERLLPRYAQSFQGVPQEGDKRGLKSFDGTGQLALETFAKVMEGMITPRDQTWHRLRAVRTDTNGSTRVLRYFDEVTKRLFHYRYLPSANFQSQMFEHYISLGAFGTGCLFLDRSTTGIGFRYRAISLAEIFIEENHQGIIDRVYRCFELTLRQMKSKFGDKLSDRFKDGRMQEKYKIIHAVVPNDDVKYGDLGAKGMAFKSVYMLEDSGEIIEEGGYSTMPYLISRYLTAPGETYGRSVGMMLLPNLKVLDEQKKTALKVGHRAADPIILTHDDGVMDTFSLVPGSMVAGAMSEDGKRMVDILPTGDLRISEALMNEERGIIREGFMVNLFQILLETPRMTATEVLQRTKEKALLMSPTMGRQQTELLGPMIERELTILAEDGELPDMPDELRESNGEYTVVYDSPLSRASRAEEAGGFMQTLEMATGLSNARGDPSALDWLNEDAAIPAIAEITSTPAAWIRTGDEVMAIRKQREEMMAAQMAIQAAPSAAAVMKAGA